jgi:hypothetical protein
MDNLDDIKKIWFTADLRELPTTGDMTKAVRRYRTRYVLIRGFAMLLALGLLAVMIWVAMNYHGDMLVTRIGEILFLTAIMILLSVNLSSLGRIAVQKDFSNDRFINYLKEEKLKHLSFQKRLQVVGFSFASAGLLFYIFETANESFRSLVIAYGLASAWILVCWLVLRPIAGRAKMKRLNDTIKKLEQMAGQLSEKNHN